MPLRLLLEGEAILRKFTAIYRFLLSLPRQMEAEVTDGTAILSGRTQFAPNGIQFTLRFCLRDAEDVVPYDEIADLRLYNRQHF